MKIFQQKTLWFLFIAALVLLIINILIDYTFKENRVENKFSLSSQDLQTRFESSLKSFGLKEEWLKKKSEKNKISNRKYPVYKIFLPGDLSIPVVLLEIYKEFETDSISIESKEIKTGGRSRLTFRTKNQLLLSAEFIYGKKIKRETGNLSFVIKDIELANLNDSLLIETADKFNVLVTPSEENINYLPFIVKHRKNYSILISDEISEPNYSLDASYSKLRILNVIKALSVDFANAAFFVIDDNFDFINSDNFEYFENELEKRYIKLKKLSDFILLHSEENLSSVFSNHVKELGEGELKIIVLSKADYLQLKPEISLFKKTGIKIVNTSENGS
ncbi:MAG: hypothetical protein KJN64_06355 [Ignavibacteria bacterium]|nr:hypothetical protein [Ignavibacteria bacterium]NNJ53983.1 hypothetical protein [Ignavibacteriaceae bacterium]